MERYSFTLKQLRNERLRSRASPTSPLFSEAEVLEVAYGIIQGLHHLFINGFIHRSVNMLIDVNCSLHNSTATLMLLRCWLNQ
jgi:hypothetical protein